MLCIFRSFLGLLQLNLAALMLLRKIFRETLAELLRTTVSWISHLLFCHFLTFEKLLPCVEFENCSIWLKALRLFSRASHSSTFTAGCFPGVPGTRGITEILFRELSEARTIGLSTWTVFAWVYKVFGCLFRIFSARDFPCNAASSTAWRRFGRGRWPHFHKVMFGWADKY